MSFIKRLLADLRTTEPIYPLCGGIGLSVLGFITLMSSGCHPAYRWLLLPRSALPYWIFAMLGIFLFFLMGAAIGIIFSMSSCQHGVYSSALCMLLDAVLIMVWYHVLFRTHGSFIAMIILLAAMMLWGLATLNIAGYHILIPFISLPVLLIQFHFLWLNIGIRFLN
ncbi:MAG: hypothetical protein E7599_05490 [Ruminococcaceae bacterium]|nr:hypothetical protein [Oscillospiraceae bacterium]